MSSGCGTDGSESEAEVPIVTSGLRLPFPEPLAPAGCAAARTTSTTTAGGGQHPQHVPIRGRHPGRLTFLVLRLSANVQ